MVNTKRSKLLNSFFFENQVRGSIHNLGKGMSLPKIKMNIAKWNPMHVGFRMPTYLGLEVSSFDNIGMSATIFLGIVRKEDNDSNQEEQEVSDEKQYQTDSRY